MSEPIRILQVVHGMDCGGAENMIMNLFRAIDRSIICFDFLVHTEKRCYFDEEIESLGGRIYHVPYYNLLNYFAYKHALKAFFSEHPEIKAVHGHLGSCADIYLSVAKQYGKHTIVHCHNSKPVKKTLKSVLYKLANIHVRSIADDFFSCSRVGGIYRYGKRIVGSVHYRQFNNAIDTEKYRFDPEKREVMRTRLGLTEEQFAIGHVGRFYAVKNHDYLLDVFSEIVNRNEQSVLILVGDGELRTRMESKANNLGLGNKVIFTGVRKDVQDLMQAMDCFVFPSYFEGLPVTLVEAQASGLNCVISQNIPPDCDFSKQVYRLPIDVPPDVWAEKILGLHPSERTKGVGIVSENGFDIHVTAKWLEQFYAAL